MINNDVNVTFSFGDDLSIEAANNTELMSAGSYKSAELRARRIGCEPNNRLS